MAVRGSHSVVLSFVAAASVLSELEVPSTRSSLPTTPNCKSVPWRFPPISLSVVLVFFVVWMASFNHHPYLATVLTSLQKHQMHLEATSAGLRNEHPEHQQIFVELPWKNDTQEWAELNKALVSGGGAAAQPASRVDSFFARVAGTFKVDGADADKPWEGETEQMRYALRQAGETGWEETGEADQPEGETDTNTTTGGGDTSASTSSTSAPPVDPTPQLPLPNNGKPVVGPRVPGNGKPILDTRIPNAGDKQERATCGVFGF